ncbi:MAG: SDR family NAD(P)-dependent oxidoreductase, partial [Pseudomonadota bacterium]
LENRETWIVMGASSSIGRAFARQAAADGADIVLAGRDTDDLQRLAADVALRADCDVDVIYFDAQATGQHEEFVDRCVGRDGSINLMLLFGTMPDQDATDADFELARQSIEVNYVGAVSVLNRFAPHLEKQGAGKVVVLSSVAGDRGRIKNYLYGSAKGALNLYLQGLRARLQRSEVSVTTVKAGFMDTDMTFGLPGMFLVASPEDCAAACLKLSDKGREVAYFPFFWWGIMTIIKAIPERIFKRLSI